MNATESIRKYTAGEMTLEEVNAALSGSGYHLDPGKNALTEDEILHTTIGTYPNQANGWGLLDTGTGTLDKVEVRGGKLVDTDLGIMPGKVIIAGRSYWVDGAELTDEKPESPAAEHLPDTPDMSRRQDRAGKTVEQRTASGVFLVTYDDLGYAVKSSRK